MSLMHIKYVGKKPRCRDRTFGTGAIWAGYGDIRAVDATAGARLLNHPDEFAEATREEYEQQSELDHGREAVDSTALEAARARAERGLSPVSQATEAAKRAREHAAQDRTEPDDGAPDPDEAAGEAPDEGETAEPADNATEESDEAEGPQMPEKPVGQLGKKALADYAERQFGHDLDTEGQSISDCRKEVRELMIGVGLIK